ncbi:MAG TPA: nickel pincer cofactor biosynthesis protein LarC [Nitrososphaeraceae archaeon]|nr:nickel pincer cofactor biosynthesis protein LarC [Nitrososphaeraceae archaeon]
MPGIAVFDSQISGISGDMLLSSLIDAGAEKKLVLDSIYACDGLLKGSRILEANFEKVTSTGIKATRFLFRSTDNKTSRKGSELIAAAARYCRQLDLDHQTSSYIQNSMQTLVEAESKIHGQSIKDVHLHEASNIDTLVDIVGSGIAANSLDLFSMNVYSTQIATGSGVAHFSHGIVPNPTNAVLQIFLGRPFILTAGYSETESTTPTGAALLVNLCIGSVNRYPDFQPIRIGFGAGTRDLGEIANVTRFVMGNSHSSFKYGNDTVAVLETNVDDITGENLGALIEYLSKSGIKDVTIIPGITKKNRPSYTIRIITDYSRVDSTLDFLFTETGTLGIRIQETNRVLIDRDTITIKCKILNDEFTIRVKVSKDSTGKIVNAKPEFDDVRHISRSLRIPLRVANQIALSEIQTRFGNEFYSRT